MNNELSKECYLDNNNKNCCFGCEACKQICPRNAISMVSDSEGFRYPKIDKNKCINCNMCRKVCPYVNGVIPLKEKKIAYGGYNKDWNIRKESTSGGVFTSLIDAYCDKNYVIFGAASDGLKVYHKFVENNEEVSIFRKSKYSQSNIESSYIDAKKFLKEGKKVVFSGTPCQIAGLKAFLGNLNQEKLLTIEVVCEGVPSPLYISKLNDYIEKKYNSKIKNIDYRNKDEKKFLKCKFAKWDFQVMKIELENGKILKKDRWFNPFWKLWLEHLMSRPSCYSCPFANQNRNADITLGDLWGVHIYCPELYGNNGGSSLILCNTEKGKKVLEKAKNNIYGHSLNLNECLKYQSPLRKSISNNENRSKFMDDLASSKNYIQILKKWYKKPNLRLFYSKYVWGNRQKIFIWNIKNGGRKNEKRHD